MADLPETENETEDKEKKSWEADENTTVHSRFAAGFLFGLLAALLCVTVFTAGWFAADHRMRRKEESRQEVQGASVLTEPETLYKLNEVRELIEQKYLNEVDGEELSAYLFKGIAAGLGDPYANYYSAEELRSVQDSSRGEYFGIGATLSADSGTREIRVVEVYEEGPAFQAGLQAGDVLRTLNDTELEEMDLSEVISTIKSFEEPFMLGIYRPDTGEELQLELECGEVQLEYVQSEMLEHKIGYICLSEFTESAVGQFKEAAAGLQEQGMEQLIVDLRNNLGGLLDSVCDILDEILPEGLIVYTEDRDGNRKEYYTDDSRLITCEVAVLVNGRSASASEIFAGAVQDWGLGPVIGTGTYGKGVVQQTYTLSDGSAFKMTAEKYYTPKGQDIDGNGITPDVTVEEADENVEPVEDRTADTVLKKAVEVLSAEKTAEK